MSQNPNAAVPPAVQNIGNPAAKQMPPMGAQSFSSMPNMMLNNAQPARPPNQYQGPGHSNVYNNPNGLADSPGTTPLPYASSPALRPPMHTSTYNNNSSLHSSRNNSPAMNHSGVSHSPVPPSQYPPQSNVMRPSFTQPSSGVPNSTPNRAPQSFPQQPPLPTSNFPRPPVADVNSTLAPQNNMLASQPPNSSLRPATNVSNSQTQPTAPNVYPPQAYNLFPRPQAPLGAQNFPPNVVTNSMPSAYPAHNQPGQSNAGHRPPMAGSVGMTGPSSLPFPGRQINSNMPPLASGLGPAAMQQPLQNVRNFPAHGPPATNSLPPNSNMQPSIRPPVNAPNVFQQPVPPPPVTNNTYPPSYQSYPPSQPPQNLPPAVQNHPQQNIPPPPTAQPQYPPQPAPGLQYAPDQYNGQQGLARQMGGMSVTQNSFSKMWGHESVDLMQCRNVLPEQKLEPPIIKLNQQFVQSINCSSEIFRCTVSKIPETHSLLQKSRLPLGILIHPFKDLNHLPVIQCSSIVRCRACRTYINPFVYFIDLKRWKCNLCYRVNDLPEEFQYDPVTKSYGDPTRRPEIQSATIEYIAPSEYMLRPPQPAAYLFLFDVSAAAAESGYLQIVCQTITEQIDSLPGDTRTQLAFICFDSAVHFYFLGEGASRPREMTVIDIEDIFLPSPEDLLVNLVERRTAILELLAALPVRHGSPSPSSTQSALGAALQAAHKLMGPTGGRITVFQTCLPNIGPGALTAREDPNNRSSKDVAHLNPATDFYKRLALDCSGVQVAVDLFLLNSQYADLSTISGISRFSGGSVYHQPLFKGNREKQASELQRIFTRYLTRKIGFEAVMRVRCTRGLAIHTFHGSFFVRSTDLLSLPNVSPDSGFGMQLAIEENLSDVQHVCFQAALLYTSSKGERRIRVHTLCLPVVSTLNDVIHSADQQCIIGLLSKMAVDRSQSSSLSDAREALINAAVDALGAHKLASGHSPGLMAPVSIRLLPLYLHALLKNPAFRTGTSTRLDDRVFAMCNMKSLPLANLMRTVYPDLYPIHNLSDFIHLVASQDSENENEEIAVPCPPRLHLSAERINSTGAYLLDHEFTMYLYIGHKVDPNWIMDTLGIASNTFIGDNCHSIPVLKTEQNTLLHAFIDDLNNERSHRAAIHVIADNSPIRTLFTDKLLDDRVESALSYYEFLQHIKSQIK